VTAPERGTTRVCVQDVKPYDAPRVSTTFAGHATENSCCLITFIGGRAAM